MEFQFNINEAFPSSVTKVNSNLLPDNFKGGYRAANICGQIVTEVIDAMGEASAKAQGLARIITSSQKLRMTNQNVYVLTDPQAFNGRGAAVGILKTGNKKLYLFDKRNELHEISPLCVLDFYVHESMQRQGCGKRLYDFMLKCERTRPEKLALNRPSDKYLSFKRKHYGLSKIIPQANKFVVYEGFFPLICDCPLCDRYHHFDY